MFMEVWRHLLEHNYSFLRKWVNARENNVEFNYAYAQIIEVSDLIFTSRGSYGKAISELQP